MESISTASDQMRNRIFQQAHIDYWTVDLNKRELQLGEIAASALHLPTTPIPLDEAKNSFAPEHRETILANLHRVLGHDFECVTIPLEAQQFGNRSLVIHVLDKTGEVLSGYLRVIDSCIPSEILTLKEVNLSSALKKEIESNQQKSAFLANMSHEIRTPLNAIVGFSKILADTESEADRQEYLKIILDNNDMLLQLIDDILDLSKIEAGTIKIAPADVNVDDLIREIADSARIRLTDPGVKIVTDFPPQEGHLLYTDRNRISQVMNNFINNAIKFTAEGSITLTCHIRPNEFYFSVTDTGTGIPSDQLDNIFRRFVRLNKKVKGTGLGLAICSSIISKLGGQIGVESEEGKGSTFWFTLPDKMPALEEPTAPEVPTPAPAPQPAAAPQAPEEENTVILIAEDDASNYKLCEVLLGHRYKLVHAWNGREAVEMFKQYNPSVILMDINMPEMNGYEASEAIRKLSWDVPILAVTAYALADDEQHIMESGFDGYLSKPLESELLDTKIHEFIDKVNSHLNK